jgi:UDP-glucuronate 4-epimerase
MSKKRIFVTGAAGFIGYHLARYLHKRGDQVVGFDNFNDYYNPQLKYLRAQLLSNEGIQVEKGDLCDFSLLEQSIHKHQPTHIVHLAAQAGVRYSLSHPHAYLKSNIEGFLNVLECSRKYPGVPLIYASSSSVYGLNDKIPFSIEDRTDHQASLYGVTKKTNELMAGTYHHLYGLPVTGLRFFTVYGPWGRPDMAYFSFTRDILSGTPIRVFNQGRMQRDFTYIDDIVEGAAAAIDLGAPCEIFNLGNHQPAPLPAMISSLERHLGKKAIIVDLPMQQGDVEITYADIEYSKAKLGFSPKTSLEVGLKKFVDWYLEHASDGSM